MVRRKSDHGVRLAQGSDPRITLFGLDVLSLRSIFSETELIAVLSSLRGFKDAPR